MPAPYARTLERLHDFLGDFDGGIFSGDVLLIKPEPAIYQLLQTRYALEPAKTVFIDDLLDQCAGSTRRKAGTAFTFNLPHNSPRRCKPSICSQIRLQPM